MPKYFFFLKIIQTLQYTCIFVQLYHCILLHMFLPILTHKQNHWWVLWLSIVTMTYTCLAKYPLILKVLDILVVWYSNSILCHLSPWMANIPQHPLFLFEWNRKKVIKMQIKMFWPINSRMLKRNQTVVLTFLC